MFEELVTNRCKIRTFKPSDKDGLFKILSDKEVMKYIEPPFTMEQTNTFVRKYGLCDEPKIFALIIDKSKFVQKQENIHKRGESGDALAGHVIFHPFEDSDLEAVFGKGNVYELGFIIAKEYWRQGIATEITEKLIEHSKQIGLSALVVECDPSNQASIKVAQNFGFELLPSANNFDGECGDVLSTYVLPLLAK